MKKKTKEEIAHLKYIAGRECVVCNNEGLEQTTRTEVHHIRAGVGMGQRASHFDTIPLCSDHHRGNHGTGYHGGPMAFEETFGTELELLGQIKCD